MKKETRYAVATLLQADPSVAEESITEALAMLEGKPPTPAQQPDRLLTIKQAAERFSCTTRTVQRWMEKGEIKGIRRGRMVRIPESELYKSDSDS